MISLLLPLVAATCPDGWTPSPNASWANQCFGVAAERSSSLRSCVELCGAEGGVPACIASAEENAFAAELIGDDWAWLGLYQNGTSGDAEQGWGRCVAGEAPGFTSWEDGLTDYDPESCVFLTGQSEWYDIPCVSSALGLTARCLCTGPATASSTFSDDLEALEAAWEEALRGVEREAAVAFAVATLVALFPTLLLLCRRAFLRLRGGGAAAGDGDGSGAVLQTARRLYREATTRKLHVARRSAMQRRLQVSGVMLQTGWALLTFGLTPSIMSGNSTGNSIKVVVGAHTYWLLIVPPGAYLLLLALLPTDARAIRTVCAMLFAVALLMTILSLRATLSSWGDDPLGSSALAMNVPSSVLFLALAAALIPTLPCGGCKRLPVLQPRQALLRLWLVMRLFYVGYGVLSIGFFSAYLATNPARTNDPNIATDTPVGGIAFGFLFLACALLATPANRGRLHRRLGRIGGRGSESEEAAAVAALVGGADPAQALERAESLFTCLLVRSVTAADLAVDQGGGGALGASTSAAELAAKTVKAKLGEVTAFLSHSWSDEKELPGAKHEALARWARRQKERTGEEPTIWLDKACIDQNNIQQSLSFLPVYLSGCQTLLILAGPTYCLRLWCVMEIFTFLFMGGKLDRIEIRALSACDDAPASPADGRRCLDDLKQQFAKFDAAKAQCFLPKDKHRLLAVVEAGFGEFHEFNTRVRTAFAERLEAPPSRTMRKLLGSKAALTALAALTLASDGQVELASAEKVEPAEVQQEAI